MNIFKRFVWRRAHPPLPIPLGVLPAVIDSLSDALILVDRQGKIQFVNASAVKILHYGAKAEIVGKDLNTIVSSKFSLGKEDFLKGRLGAWEGFWRARDDAELRVFCSCTAVKSRKGKLTHFLYIAKDTTELKHAENSLLTAYRRLKETGERLVQSEKAAVTRRLAAGIAHEIRNPLAIVMQGAYLLKSAVVGNKEAEESIVMIKDAVKRADTIISRLLEYSRAAPTLEEAVDVCALLENVLFTLQEALAAKKVKPQGAWTGPLTVKADKNSLEQALYNIVVNALEAVEPGGTISIKAASEGGNCRLEFTDNGCGITEENLGKIFEPFYTTKLSSKNSGLGLTLVQVVVDRCHGKVNVVSVPAQGTKVTLTLPLYK